MEYDSSVKKNRKGCNYCLRRKTIESIDDGYYDNDTAIIDDEQKMLVITDYEDNQHYYSINFCPVCGKNL